MTARLLNAAPRRSRRPRWSRRPRRPRPTVRLRLTAWYGGLFLVCGTVLLAVTYALVAGTLVGNAAGNALCRAPGVGCVTVGAAQARAPYEAVLNEFLSRSALALALTAVLSVAAGWLIAGRALRPLRTITAAAREISATSLSERLALGGPDDELKELGDTFDGLLARLEAAFGAQRQFIANAAHELRTPLARQRVISQVALADPAATAESLRAAHERVLAAGLQQQQLIDALLTLARGQGGLDHREPFDLAAVTCEVVAARRAEAGRRTVALHATLAPALVTGSPRLVERLAANLVDNALRHNVPRGRVDVSTQVRGGRAVLSVTNTGPPVPAATMERLFRPFQRLAPERTGAGLGLGLSVVQAIADTHGADVTACPRPGGGLVVEVAFPGALPGAQPASARAALPVARGEPGWEPGHDDRWESHGHAREDT